MTAASEPTPMAARFRGFLPVVVDVETGGLNPATDALLEIAIVLVEMDAHGIFRPVATHGRHVEPFAGANIEQSALDFHGIDPHHPLRGAVPEHEALGALFREVRRAVKNHGCSRAILVGHNPALDLGFVNAAAARCRLKRNPFHPFSCFDTATLGGLAFGQTVLSRAVQAAGIEWQTERAHTAVYDAQRTAELFCLIVNRWGAWQRAAQDGEPRG